MDEDLHDRVVAIEREIDELRGRLDAVLGVQLKMVGALDGFWAAAIDDAPSYAAHLVKHLRLDREGPVKPLQVVGYLQIVEKLEAMGDAHERNSDE